MSWAYAKWGDAIYTELSDHRKSIEAHLESEEISLNARNRKALFSLTAWREQKALLDTASELMAAIGLELYLDFNVFRDRVETEIKSRKLKLSASKKNQFYGAVIWREETAEKVIKKIHRLKVDKLKTVLKKHSCTRNDLPDYGYWPGAGANDFIEYESDSDLRDTENVPLKDDIHVYFQREVRPHVDDAWIHLDQTKIGYEISFNKYFYQHKPLRSLEEVTADILRLEAETEGLLKKLVNFGKIT